MKFLCDNCKAKYQIADDKVAGKTVRMKCRKCGHLIEIRASAALAEATAFRSLPAEELSRIVDEPARTGLSAPVPTPAPTPAAGARPARPVTAPLPSAGARPAPRPAAPARPANNTVPLRASGGSGAAAGAAARAKAPEPAPEPPPPSKAAPASGALASAFTKAVADEPKPDEAAASSAFDMGSASAPEEWYSGINGVPVGPMRLSELRSKMAAGQVTEDSLVWREGFEEWVALRTVPGLVEVLRSAQQQNERMSMLPGARPNRPGSAAKNNVVALHAAKPQGEEPRVMNDEATSIYSGDLLKALGAAKAAEKPADAPSSKASPAPVAVSDPFADPFAPPPPASGSASAATAAAAAAGASAELADPFFNQPSGSMMPVAPMVPMGPSASVDAHPVAPPPARIPAAAWVVVFLALAVGLVGGSMLFQPKEKDPEVKIVTVEKSTPTSEPSATATAEPPPPPTESTAKKTGPAPKSTVTAQPTVNTAPTTTAPAPTTTPTSVSPPLPGPPTNSGETIPASQLQSVVSGQRNSIRRVCWDPMVSSGAATGSVKANVQLSITNGQVTSVSVSGVEGRLAGCIQARVRGWQFPTGYAPTSTSFVLAFATQLARAAGARQPGESEEGRVRRCGAHKSTRPAP